MRREREFTVLAIAALCGLAFRPPAAEGALVTIQIEAVVDSVQDEGDYLEGKVQPGDTMTGFYVYESTTPDSSPSDPVQGNYWRYAPPAGIALTVGGFNFMTDPFDVAFHVAIRNDIPEDIYAIVSFSNLALSNGVPVDRIWWQLKDNTGSALLSDSLPTTAPVLDHWEANVLVFGADRRYGIKAHVSSAIPEPASIILLSIGGLFLRERSWGVVPKGFLQDRSKETTRCHG